jgi:(S)-2-hydroxyglutarate dehydrogenase
MTRTADVAIVGGGIVGLAMAHTLLERHPDLDVVVFEKESRLGEHASGRNSGVLHSGFYYAPDTLKATLTRRGNQMLKEFCRERGVPVRDCGKVVVTGSEAELPGLRQLFDRGVANGVDVHLIDEGELRDLEPLARTVGQALWSPTTSVANPYEVIEALAAQVRSAGATVRLGARVESGAVGHLTVSGQRWDVGHVVNSAGLYADVVGSWFGFCDDYVVLPFKGLYWLGNWPEGRLRHHVYPVPDPRNPFLGVHLTVTATGGVEVGPTAIPSLWREDYGGLSNVSFHEVRQTVRQYPSFLTSPNNDLPALIRSEVPKYMRRELVREARALVPSIDQADFRIKGRPGVRAQMWSIPGRRLEMDFVVRGDADSTHLLNVVSPGWTSSLAVAEHVVARMEAAGAI